MLIIGAKGLAKEVLEVLYQNNDTDNSSFFDNINLDIHKQLYNKFPILNSYKEVELFFKTNDNRFTLGIGNPILRKKMYQHFINLGGEFTSAIAKNSSIGNFGTKLGIGCNIMQKVVITNDVIIGKGVLVNQLSSVGHDSIIGDFVEICPSVSVSGNCYIGENSFLGTNSVILPKVKIGNNVTIGAGAVVTKDIPDNSLAVGIPAKILK